VLCVVEHPVEVWRVYASCVWVTILVEMSYQDAASILQIVASGGTSSTHFL
jgi:hypothetical protein